jgi:hypothetical protein
MEVSKDVVKSMLVLQTRVGSMATKGGNSIRNVRASANGGIHEHPHGTLIGFDINLRGSEFGKMLVSKDESGRRTGVGEAILFENVLYILVLHESNPTGVPVPCDLHA